MVSARQGEMFCMLLYLERIEKPKNFRIVLEY